MKHMSQAISAACIVFASAAVLAQSGGTQSHSNAHSGGGVPSSMSQAMHGSMSKMQGMQPTGNADHDFVMMMREHHQGAIDMSQAYLKDGKDPEIRKMAEKIISDQKKEIAAFEQWQRKHKPSTTK